MSLSSIFGNYETPRETTGLSEVIHLEINTNFDVPILLEL